MVDVFTKEKRSQVMSAVRSKDTSPEILIRKALHARGYRYSLHRKNLPGTPDLVLRKFRAVLFVNGCFWHGHNCSLFKLPTTNQEFWQKKIQANRDRDSTVNKKLFDAEWRVLIVWECSIRGGSKIGINELIVEIEDWLTSSNRYSEIGSTNKIEI